ncbi:MAG: hypothetical protein WA064_02580 [Candidatus Moraniibacteriota bacterium]
MKKSIVSIVSAFVFLAIAVAAFATTTTSILVNGKDYNQVWRPECAAPSVEIEIQTDEVGVSADYWLLCLTPSGWKYYHSGYGYWFDGGYPACQGALYSFGKIDIPIAGLDFSQPGTYTFYWGIDNKMDGQITGESFVYDSLSINVIPADKQIVITISDTFQTIGFDLSTGAVNGFVVDGVAQPIALSALSIESVMEVSDRVGWTDNSIATTAFDPGGVTWIPNTANNDKAQWVLKLKSGKIAWLNLDQVVFAGKPVVRTTDGLIQYGSYRTQTIYFASGQAYIDFACNLTDGFVSHVNPADIAYVRWSMDGTDWSKSPVWGALQTDSSGNYYVQFFSGVTGSGLFSAVLKNGTVVYMNKDSWALTGASLVGERVVVK